MALSEWHHSCIDWFPVKPRFHQATGTRFFPQKWRAQNGTKQARLPLCNHDSKRSTPPGNSGTTVETLQKKKNPRWWRSLLPRCSVFPLTSGSWDSSFFPLEQLETKPAYFFFNTTGYLILPFHSTKNGVSSQSEIFTINLFSFIQEPGW